MPSKCKLAKSKKNTPHGLELPPRTFSPGMDSSYRQLGAVRTAKSCRPKAYTEDALHRSPYDPTPDRQVGRNGRLLAAWDKPLPPLPKISPYACAQPCVPKRLKAQKAIALPLKDATAEGRLEDAPPKPQVKSCSAPAPQPPQYNSSEASAFISREAKLLYRPHGLPLQIAKLKPLVKYTDGLHLRSICEHIRNHHWAYLSNQKLYFREKAWRRMNVEGIPSGQLMDSFVYGFVTYLPYISHLPIYHEKNRNPY